jgi:phosphoglycerol transferase MdoB-like AlkP superfamily enzyme
MTPDLQKYYDNRFSTMATQGWDDLIDDAKEIFKAVNNIAPIATESDLFYRKGQLDILQWLLSLKDSSAAAYEQLLSGDMTDGS